MAKLKTKTIQPFGEDMKWKVQNAIQTLSNATEIQKDRPLMREVKKSVANLHKNIVNKPTTRKTR